MTFLENALHYDDYFHLRQSVNWNNFSEQQTVFALNHTLYSIIAKSEQETIAMGRLIGDGLYYTIVDVIVNPAFQGQGIGSAVIHKLLNYVEKNTPPAAGTSLHQGLFFTYNLRKAVLLQGVEEAVCVGHRDLQGAGQLLGGDFPGANQLQGRADSLQRGYGKAGNSLTICSCHPPP